MNTGFDEHRFLGLLVQGDLRSAVSYLGQYEENRVLYARYQERFDMSCEEVKSRTMSISSVLQCYHRYYRNVFWKQHDPAECLDRLCGELCQLLQLEQRTEMEFIEVLLEKWFAEQGLSFMGGKTDGYYGPYIWTNTETSWFDVELPDGMAHYAVKLLDGFIEKSWLDYLSFGRVSTGGWAEPNGRICCIRESYDLESEAFQVSLLKHEAQHVQDMEKYGKMKQEELEYRAKLVEIAYSVQRDLLLQFRNEAMEKDGNHAHASAAARIISDFDNIMRNERLKAVDLGYIEKKRIALKLFAESTVNAEMEYKLK